MEQAPNKIRFSVIIPAFNSEATIGRAIQSCLDQTYPAFEIIVVDDAGTDRTEEIATSFSKEIQYIKRINNGGGAAARNTGLGKATGNYIAFLDADDIWHPEKLMLIATIIESKPGMELVFHPFTMKAIETISIPESTLLYKLPFVKLLSRNSIATPCTVIRNRKEYRFESSMRHMEDYELWLRIAYKHPVYFIKVPLTQLGRPLMSAGGVSQDSWKMRKGELKAYSRLVKSNPFFALLMPLLYTLSIGKHIIRHTIGR